MRSYIFSNNSKATEMVNTEEKLNVPVEDVMTRQVHTVNVSARMNDVRTMMAHFHIRHTPVLKDGKLVGILSLTDVQRMIFSNTYGDEEAGIDDAISDMFNAEMIMHKDPETLNFDNTVRDAANKFIERDFHALPVIKQDKLVGIITTTDILKYFTQIL